MLRLNIAIFMLVTYVNHLEGKLPDFINPCHIGQPELAKCIRERAKEAVPHIIKGIPELDIPPLANVKLPLFTTSPDEAVVVTFDGNLEGLADIGYKYVLYNKTARRGSAQMFFPKLTLTGKYLIKGTIVDKHVNGEGDATITFSKPHYDYDYSLGKIEKDGTTYFNVGELVLTASKAEGAKYQFSNLSGGDEVKDAELNKYINDNWEVLHIVLGRVVGQNILDLAFSVANKIFHAASVDEVFLP